MVFNATLNNISTISWRLIFRYFFFSDIEIQVAVIFFFMIVFFGIISLISNLQLCFMIENDLR
jgi:hypothetical protein